LFSGLGYPIIRGEAPGQTGTFIDDVKVPLLYHLGFGPAVVHPLYLDSLDFHPGNFPAEFGRFTGGLIRAKTTPAPEERKTMLELDLFKASAFHAQPFTLWATRAPSRPRRATGRWRSWRARWIRTPSCPTGTSRRASICARAAAPGAC